MPDVPYLDIDQLATDVGRVLLNSVHVMHVLGHASPRATLDYAHTPGLAAAIVTDFIACVAGMDSSPALPTAEGTPRARLIQLSDRVLAMDRVSVHV